MCNEHVEVQRRVLAANEEIAERIRRGLQGSGTLMVNLISSPGSGKTRLLEATIPSLRNDYRMAAVEGDVATELDAERLRTLGIPARQILTGGACHLDARQIDHELGHLGRDPYDILFVENVGNLVCPATYDLGEDFKVVLLSVTEGDDKPFKYPAIFSHAAATIVTKSDLLPHVEFDLDRVRDQVATLNPDAAFLVTSAQSGAGIDAWCRMLVARLDNKREGAVSQEQGVSLSAKA